MIYLRTSSDKIIKWKQSRIPTVKISKTGQISMKYRGMNIISSGPSIVSVCDVFVYLKHGSHYLFSDEVENPGEIEAIYAAIWTKTGLKFIAEKINGKWELL